MPGNVEYPCIILIQCIVNMVCLYNKFHSDTEVFIAYHDPDKPQVKHTGAVSGQKKHAVVLEERPWLMRAEHIK